MSRYVHFLKVIILLFSGLFFPGVFYAQDALPEPPASPQRLFYVQRTGNTNTIIYDANTIANGRAFNTKQPILVYWIRYADDGRTAPLNYLQRTLAYGVEVRPVSKPEEYEFNFVSYSKRKLHLGINAAGKPYALIAINGKQARLNRVFVKMGDKKVGLVPDVKYVELFGTDPQTGAAVYEKFVP